MQRLGGLPPFGAIGEHRCDSGRQQRRVTLFVGNARGACLRNLAADNRGEPLVDEREVLEHARNGPAIRCRRLVALITGNAIDRLAQFRARPVEPRQYVRDSRMHHSDCKLVTHALPGDPERGNIRAMTGIEDYEFQPEKSVAPTPEIGGGPRFPRGALIAVVIVVVAIAAAAYFLFTRRSAPSKVATPATTSAAQAPKTAADDFEHIDLPPLDDSDALVRQRIGILSSNRLVAAWLATRGLIRNFVVVVENTSHGMNPSRHLSVLKPAGQFRVMTRGSQVVVDPRNYDRFSPIEEAAASIDARAAGRLYQSFKPLLQTAYDELGNQEPIDRAVARAVSSLLQVPAIDGDVRVEQTGEGIGYQYADERLEALSGAQKQLLRMGPKNLRIIQSQLRTFATTIGIPVN